MDPTSTLEFHFSKLTDDSGSFGHIICLAEGDNVYHVETKFGGRFFSADPQDGVRFLPAVEHQDDPNYWCVVGVPEQAILSTQLWAETLVRQPYDYFGAINSALGIPLRNPYAWYCSLLGEEIATRSGILSLAPLPSPATLRRQLLSHISVASDPAPVAGLAMRDEDFDFVQRLVDSRKIGADLAERIFIACSK